MNKSILLFIKTKKFLYLFEINIKNLISIEKVTKHANSMCKFISSYAHLMLLRCRNRKFNVKVM